jgi:hypothetical protein
VLTRNLHFCLSWTRSMQSTPVPYYLNRHLIFSSHLRLGLPCGLFLSRFSTKSLCASLLSAIHTKRPAHIILGDLIMRLTFDEKHEVWKSSLCRLLPSPVTSPQLGRDIFCSSITSNISSLCFGFSVTGQVSNPHKTAGKNKVMWTWTRKPLPVSFI